MAKKKVMLRREPSASNVADLGTKHFTKERFETLRGMADILQAGSRNIVKYVGTITCDDKEALGLARVKSSLTGASATAKVFGLIWMYKNTVHTTTNTIANHEYSDRFPQS